MKIIEPDQSKPITRFLDPIVRRRDSERFGYLFHRANLSYINMSSLLGRDTPIEIIIDVPKAFRTSQELNDAFWPFWKRFVAQAEDSSIFYVAADEPASASIAVRGYLAIGSTDDLAILKMLI